MKSLANQRHQKHNDSTRKGNNKKKQRTFDHIDRETIIFSVDGKATQNNEWNIHTKNNEQTKHTNQRNFARTN